MDSDTVGSELLHRLSTKLTAIVCLTVAILFLSVHLIVFVITEHERTIMGKNFAMLCLAMMLGYMSYIGNMVLQSSSQSCLATVVACHYLSIAQSAWLLSTSMETWKSIKTSKGQREYELKNSWRHCYYSLYSWMMPAAVSAATLYLEFGDTDWLRPRFLEKSCSFGHPGAFFLLHILPVNANLTLNFSFLAATIWKLKKMQTCVHTDVVREFQYYLKLNVLIGFSWLVGLISEYTRNELITVIYVLLNAIQGLYIFLIMTFHDKISTFIYYDDNYDLKMLTQDVGDGEPNQNATGELNSVHM